MPHITKKIPEYDPVAELVRVNPVPSMIIDMQTLTIAVVNEAATSILGYSEKELLGRSIMELVPAEDVNAVQHAVDEPPPEGETRWRCLKRDHTLLYVKLKYRETIYRDRPARFIVAIETSPTPFNQQH